MRTVVLAAALLCGLNAQAMAWGPEGHSVTAEVAQRRLSPPAAKMVEHLLGKGHALAAIASWADNMRVLRPATANWHFVDIPIAAASYDAARDCRPVRKAIARSTSSIACETSCAVRRRSRPRSKP